jgi:hypothetical protein
MKLIMENWRDYQRQQFLLENEKYVTDVLGLSLPLNEEVLSEHILLENFLGSLAQAAQKAAGDAKNFYTTIASVIKDPAKIGDFLGFLNVRVIRTAADKLRKVIEVVINIPGLRPIVEKISQMLEGAIQKYNSMQTSWVKLLAGMALGAGLHFVSSKASPAWEKIKEKFKEMLTPEGIANLSEEAKSLIKTQVLDIAAKLLGQGIVDKAMKKFTDIKNYLGAIGPVVGGVKFFLDVLSPATSTYAPQTSAPFIIRQRGSGTAQ